MAHWHNAFMICRQRLARIHDHKAFKASLFIIQRLREQGFEAVFAGGCVRDSLLGFQPKDIDIATSATPAVVEKTFSHTLGVGRDFGTIIVVEDEENIEVTTYRIDGPYTNGRHPSHVKFSGIEEDAKRRDFTINALYYCPLKGEIFDYVGGVKDLHARVLRTVGCAQDRFHEDRLRMLRAVRFVAQLGFSLDSSALAAIKNLHLEMRSVSAERILNEVKKLLIAPHLRDGLRCLLNTHLYEVFWPEIAGVDIEIVNRFPKFTGWENAFAALMIHVSADPEPRLRAWKASRESLRKVHEQIRGVTRLLAPDARRAERARILGADSFADVLVLASGLSENQQRIEGYIGEYLTVAERTGCLPEPFVNGDDLMQFGVEPGLRLGQCLRALFDAQLEGKIRSRQEALERIPEFLVGLTKA